MSNLALGDVQKLNFVLDFECCYCEHLACRSVLTQDDLPMFVHARAH